MLLTLDSLFPSQLWLFQLCAQFLTYIYISTNEYWVFYHCVWVYLFRHFGVTLCINISLDKGITWYKPVLSRLASENINQSSGV